jgi:four helix bundle protein
MKVDNEKTFRRLIFWQKAMVWVTNVYELTNRFPKSEMFGLTSQINKRAVSIPSNITEGYGRKGTNDYLRFLNISLSSLDELQTQLEIAYNLEFISKVNFDSIYEDTREIERIFTSYTRQLKL